MTICLSSSLRDEYAKHAISIGEKRDTFRQSGSKSSANGRFCDRCISESDRISPRLDLQQLEAHRNIGLCYAYQKEFL